MPLIKPFLSKGYLIVAIMLCCLVAACSRKKSTTPLSSLPVITYAGVNMVGDSIIFDANEPAGSTYLWYFGDTTTSTLGNPAHVYSAQNSYQVRVVVNGQYNGAYMINIFNDPLYTMRLPGSWHWHHIYGASGVHGVRDTSYSDPDTTFTIRYINELTLGIATDTLHFQNSGVPYSSGDTSLSFSHVTATQSDGLTYDRSGPDPATLYFRRYTYTDSGAIFSDLFYTY